MPLAEITDVSANPVADPLSLYLERHRRRARVQSRLRFQNWPTRRAADPLPFPPVAALSYVPGCAADLRPEVGLGGPNGGLP